MEIWKDIEKYEGKYKISNLERVKSLSRNIKPTAPGQTYKTCKEKILKTCIGSHGYYHVSLEGRKHCIHKLVAAAFIENPNKYNCINHKDGNKLNNTIENLEWCNHKINNNRAFNKRLIKSSIRIKASFYLDGTIMIFRSKAKAREYLNMSEKLLNKGLKIGEIGDIKLELLK